MGVYKRIVITDNGNELISQALAGEKVVRFSRASTSDYSYPDGTNFAQLTNLQGEKQSVIPSNIEVTDSLVSIRTLFENADIITPYLIQNIGLYAADGEGEILFGITQADTPDQMPAYNGVAPSSFIYNIHLAISQTSDLTIAVNPSGTVTMQDLMELDNRKVSIRGGDISDTVVSSLEDHTEAFPVPMPGDKTKGLWGKLKKWQQDCLAKFGNYVLTSMITNQHLNDTNHIPSSALVYLMQQAITQLNMDIGELNSQTRDMHSAETLTIGASFTYYAGGYIKVGRVVIVSLSFFVKYDALGNPYIDIISGLPLPLAASPLSLWTFKRGTSAQNYPCRIMPFETSGIIYGYGDFTVADELQIAGSYIVAN